ncbi:MAG: DNA-binding protein [Nanoarchaeota archaeon]|nr:DNA-binding protein [Nanoarchaeota archaeon]
MAIKDLKAREGNVDVVVEVVSKEEPREFEKFGKKGRVCTAVVKDESGETKLTLWNDDIDKVKEGDKLHITNGYVNEWQGELQLTTGKFGKLEVVTE